MLKITGHFTIATSYFVSMARRSVTCRIIFACEIFRKAKVQVNVIPVSTEEYGAKAPRPHNSRMSKEKLTEAGFEHLPSWQDALERYLRTIGE